MGKMTDCLVREPLIDSGSPGFDSPVCSLALLYFLLPPTIADDARVIQTSSMQVEVCPVPTSRQNLCLPPIN